MYQLADISIFNSYIENTNSDLLSDSYDLGQTRGYQTLFGTRQRGFGRRLIQKHLFRADDYNSKNRVVARRTGRQIAKEMLDKGFRPDYCRQIIAGYDTAGRMCDNLGCDGTRLLKKVTYIPWNGRSHYLDGAIYINTRSNYVYADIVHELAHALTKFTKMGAAVESRTLPAFYGKYYDRGNGRTYKKDLLRSFLSGNQYAAKTYENNGNNTVSEYLPTMLSQYLVKKKIPFFWALDIIRKLRKVKGTRL